MTALAGVELESLVSKPNALTTRPPPCAPYSILEKLKINGQKLLPPNGR